MTVQTETAGRKRKIFTFIIALFGAFLLWMYAIGYDTEISENTFDGIPVQIIGVNTNGYTVADAENFSLQIGIRAMGTRSELSKYDAGDFSAYVDISSVSGPGYTTLPVTVVAPNGLNAEPATVSNVTLYVDTFTSRTINVSVEKTYSSQYTIGEIKQDVYAVSIYGPESVISTAEAYTSFTLGNVTADSIRVSGEIKLRDSVTKAAITNQYITMSKSTVEVVFTMYGNKTVPVELLFSDTSFPHDQAVSSLSTSSLTLYGPLSELSAVDSLEIVCDDGTSQDKISGVVTVADLLATNGLDARIQVLDSIDEIAYAVEMPAIRYLAVNVPVSRIIVYGVPEDGTVLARAVKEVTVFVLGTASAIEAYNTELMTIMVNYNTLTARVSGEYSGTAEISTGDSRVCVDDAEYTVSVEVTIFPAEGPQPVG